jgi:hypothetical protein
MDLNFTLKFELGDAPQILAQDFFLDFELMLVAGLLIMASAAAAEMRTRRRDAVRRRLHDGFGFRADEAGFFFGDDSFDLFSGENEGDEDGLTASAVFIRRSSLRRSGGKAS